MDGTYSPLNDQIIRLRPKHEGLNYQYCKLIDPFGECKELAVIDYPSTKETADELQKLGFVCKAYSKRYKPCFQGSFGLCHVTYTGGIWGIGAKEVVTFIDLKTYHDQLMDANLKCFNDSAYSFDDM